MRILVIQKMAKTSGSELYLLKLLPRLIKQGVECAFLSISLPDDVKAAENFDSAMQASGVPFHKIVTRSVVSPALLKQIYTIYKKGNFDLIHTHLVHADFWGAMVKMIFDRRTKLVSTKHGYDEGFQADFGFDYTKKRFDRYFITALLAEKFINRSAAVSKGLYDFYIGQGICKKHNIETIPYGLDFEEEKSKTEVQNCRFFRSQLIIVGRLIPYKGHNYVFECLLSLVKKYPDLGLVLVGNGTSELQLREQVKELGIEKYVRFEGLRRNVHDYIAQSDILLMPSRSEGFGIVMLEAWFHKKPVIAFDVPAPNTIITNNQNGILITPFNTRELEESISKLITNPEERARLGESGFQTLKTEYSPEKMVNSTIWFYKKALSL